MTRLWAWLQCLTSGHLPVWMGDRREGPTVIAVYRCKQCKRFTEVRYRNSTFQVRGLAFGSHFARGG